MAEATNVPASTPAGDTEHKTAPEEAQALTQAPGIPDTAAPAAVMNPKADIAALNSLEMHLYGHRYAETMMGCFGPSIDPVKATHDRGEAQAILEEEDQELLCAKNTGDLLERLQKSSPMLTRTQRAQVRILRRERERLENVPAEEQAAFTRLLAESGAVWHKAKAANDWASFEPYLDRVVNAMRHIASCQDPNRNPYDVWLDYYEQGTSRAFYNHFFREVKNAVVPLLEEISKRPQLSRRVVEGRFEEARQWALARDLMDLEGLDPDVMVLTKTEHPYSDGLTTNYAMIAAHVHEEDVLSNLYTMLHEGGHALYETGVDPSLNYTSLKGGTSMGMHEGQSRFFENYVGRSEAFAPALLKLLRKHFPGQFSRVSARQFYMAANRVEPSLIRTEADELTYPLHIIIRYEIEQLLMEGDITAQQVPMLWADRYKKYLGVRVPDYTHGALQDTHWADGLIGYFPTYALGGAYGAQLRHQMIQEGMDFEGVLATGDIEPIRAWLKKHVWQWGRTFDPQEIIQNACGEPFNVSYYTDYLVQKFSALYDL